MGKTVIDRRWLPLNAARECRYMRAHRRGNALLISKACRAM